MRTSSFHPLADGRHLNRSLPPAASDPHWHGLMSTLEAHLPFTTRKRWRKQVLAQGVEEEDEEPLPPPPPPTAAGLRERAPLKRGLGGGKREDSQGSVAVEEMCFAMYVEHIPGSAWHSPGSHSCSVAYWVPLGWLQSSFARSTVLVQYSRTAKSFFLVMVFFSPGT